MTILHQKVGFLQTDITYQERDIFKVYVRKSNSTKKLRFTTKDVSKAIDFYNSYKIFANDTKYLEAVRQDGSSHKLLRTKGLGASPKYIAQGRPKREKFRMLPLHRIVHLPESLMLSFKDKMPEEKTIVETVGTLLAFFCDMNTVEIEDFFKENEKHYSKHKFDSGLTNSEEIVKVLIEEELL